MQQGYDFNSLPVSGKECSKQIQSNIYMSEPYPPGSFYLAQAQATFRARAQLLCSLRQAKQV
jgi:hypothetical protein